MAKKKAAAAAPASTATATSTTTTTSTGSQPARRRVARSSVQLAFETVRIEGALLSPEWLTKVAKVSAPSQGDDDYRVVSGLSLREELARYWKIARNAHLKFKASRDAGGDPAAAAETFVVFLLRTVFGFESLAPTAPLVVDGHTYPVAHAALGGRVPVVVAPAPQPGEDLETPRPQFGDAGKKKSAFALLQEFLNVRDEALWGVCCDGVTLRLVRDNASLTRPAFIEADLDRLFGEERYTDFSALWLLVHESRFGSADRPVYECPLERWREEGQKDGTRARDHLRDSVEGALKLLGNGFLRHKDSRALRESVRDGSLTAMGYYQQLLRLVYRQIFLLAAEERGLLHPDESRASDSARTLYAEGYSLRRLRERAVRRTAWDRHHDVWSSLQIVFGALDQGDARLALPPLAGLFASHQCHDIDAARIENREFLHALYKLAWLPEESGISRVNWRDMGPEELGSVYESLLELVPQFVDDGRGFGFADENQGNARKTSGSYYTPASLVDVLLDSALDPVMKDAEAAHPEDPSGALLSLSIVDPACGSGHFLLAAARRLASRVAAVRAQGAPSRKEYQHALREVVGKCIYGVDLNPMAVELCKVALWMEAVEPGLPLTFLNSHIQHGNALLGTTPELMAGGIPDVAWDPIEGDDRATASSLKKRNKAGALGQRGMDALWAKPPGESALVVAAEIAALETVSDDDPQALAAKEQRWDGILGSPAYREQKMIADAWCAAFVWPKQPGALAEAAPTNEVWRALRDAQGRVSALTTTTTAALAQDYRFFHWHLQFPQVFKKGGFDTVLGNPPWERVKIQEQEFFASRDTEIANAANAAARKKLIARLPATNAVLWEEWAAASRRADGESHALRQSGRYPLCGKGDVNTYAIFAEHNRQLTSRNGRAGFIVPAGIATDDSTKAYFEEITREHQLVSFYGFENEEKVFPGVHNQFKFALICLDGSRRSKLADLVFFARQASALAEPERHVVLTPADFGLLNPNTKTCPTFRSKRDAEINLAMYRRAGVLWREEDPDGNPWGLRFLRMFDMANDSGLFRTRKELEAAGWTLEGNEFVLGTQRVVPLVEAKMVHLFDSRYATYKNATQANLNKGTLPRLDDEAHRNPMEYSVPEVWISKDEVDLRIADRWLHDWFIGWRDITRSVDERTMISAVVPRTAIGHTLPLLLPSVAPHRAMSLYACLCSFAFDYAARQKVGGTHLTYGYLKQLPAYGPSFFTSRPKWVVDDSLLTWLGYRVIELVYTSWELCPLSEDLSRFGSPYRWDSARRTELRCELDAAFFHLYGLSRDDTDYIMETFTVVKRKDEVEHGEYRTKRVILEIYDAMAEAIRTGIPYQTRLDPPPADPRVAHPESTRPAWAKKPS